MGSKHDILTEEEMNSFQLSPAIVEQLRAFALQATRQFDAQPLKILDWGCGRGRAVATLRSEGHSAFGVDVDRAVMANGYPLFLARGFDPSSLLLHADDVKTMDADQFDIICSEETIEHITDLRTAAREMFRLLRPGGIAIHSFPGALWLIEPHIHIPIVHWLPNSKLRRMLVTFFLTLGFGPSPPWPEARNRSLHSKSAIYSRYLLEKTCYRSESVLNGIFRDAGFDSQFLRPRAVIGWHRLLPAILRNNGFPSGHVLLLLTKPTATASIQS